MSEDSELEAKIARLTGRIERHKAQEDIAGFSLPQHQPYVPDAEYQRPARSAQGYAQGNHSFHPYGHSRPEAPDQGYSSGRTGPIRATGHRNRTLILNAGATRRTDIDSAELSSGKEGGTRPAGWVSRHDRHKQLINNSVYEQKTQERTKAIEETQKKKQAARAERQKAKIMRHVQASAVHTDAQPAQASPTELIIDGVRFLVADGGSKLIKASDDLNQACRTPKMTTVGGVKFHRSKHGNLYRSGLVKMKRDRAALTKSSQLCQHFTSTGTCPQGPLCRFTHDPAKVAMCREYLSKGTCALGEACDLSHDPTAARVPACLHFQRDACTNDKCRYAHVRTNPSAPVCTAFARLGYCDIAEACPDRHVHECPDYANKGDCRQARCRLPHVDRAGQLRKAAKRNSDHSGDDDAASDLSSDDNQVDSDDVDSDDMTEVINIVGDDKHELSQQVDYVHF